MALLKKSLIAGAALLLSVGSASAVTITQSNTFGPQNTDFTVGPFTFNSFNTSLGTLNSVSLTFSATSNYGGNVKNNAPTAQTFRITESTDLTVSSTVTQIDGLTVNNSKQQTYTALAAGATAPFGPSSNTAAVTYNAAPADFAAFQGGPITYSVYTLTGTTTTGGGGNIQNTITTTANGTLTLVYDYTAAPPPPPPPAPTGVPEPASMALLGAGLAGLGLLRRRA